MQIVIVVVVIVMVELFFFDSSFYLETFYDNNDYLHGPIFNFCSVIFNSNKLYLYSVDFPLTIPIVVAILCKENEKQAEVRIHDTCQKYHDPSKINNPPL